MTPKHYIYIFAFMVAGALAGFLVTISVLAWVLSAPSLEEQVSRLIISLPRFAAVIGGLFGLLLGRFFWPRIYRSDGSVKIVHWKTWLKHAGHIERGFKDEDKKQ